MAAKFARLTESMLLTASTSQDPQEAVDAGAYNTVVVQANVHVVGTGGASIQMQHAAVLKENQFENIGTAIPLTTPGGAHSVTITGHSRFIRWSTTAGTGTPVASIDLVMRE